jgi:hypothetical protein
MLDLSMVMVAVLMVIMTFCLPVMSPGSHMNLSKGRQCTGLACSGSGINTK